MQMNPQNGEGGGPVDGPNEFAELQAAEDLHLAEDPRLAEMLRLRTQLLAERAGLVDRLEAASRSALPPRTLRFPATPAPARRSGRGARVAAALVAAAIGISLFVWPQAPQAPHAPHAPLAEEVAPGTLQGTPAGTRMLAGAVTESVGGLVGTPSEPVLVSLLADSDVVEARGSRADGLLDPIDLLRTRDASYRKLASEVQLIALASRGAP